MVESTDDIQMMSDTATQDASDDLAKATEARVQAEQQLADAEEAVKSAEEEVAKLEDQGQDQGQVQDQGDAIQAEEEKTQPTFADVKAEDVKVEYVLNPTDDGSSPEVREAQVNALSNGSGALTLSFTDPDAATNATSSYVVSIGSLKLFATVSVDIATPVLSVESGGVQSSSESCDVTIKVDEDEFASGVTADDVTLGGSFREMSVNGVEAAGDTLTVHLSGSPTRDYDTESTWVDGQITVAANGFENSPLAATAFVPIDLPDDAFNTDGDETLAPASVLSEAEYVGFDGDTAKATLVLVADLGTFGDVEPEHIALEDSFEGGKVESVSKEGEDDDTLKVEVSFPKGEEPEDDYLYAGTLRFAEGAVIDEYGNAAKDVSTTTLLFPEEMGRDGESAEDAAKKAAEAKKKADEAKSKKLASIGSGFKYAAGWVEKVDPALGDIANYGSSVFGMASDFVKGDWLGVVKGGVGMLQMCGLIPAGEKEVTPKDVLKEVKSLREVANSIDFNTKETLKENREDRFTAAEVRLKQMQDDIYRCYVMFDKAAEMLADRKDNPMKAPAAGASNEEAVKYNAELSTLMLQQQALRKEGKIQDPMFANVEATVNRLQSQLSETCKWLSIDKKAVNSGANPIDVLDKLVAMKFNWDTQGYYARAAFRAEATVTIQEAWAIVSTFNNATSPSMVDKFQPDLDNVGAALQQIALRPAGQSPEEVRKLNQAGEEINVYSPSLGCAIKQSRYVTSGYAFGDPGKLDSKNYAISRKEQITTEAQMTTYRDRLYEGDIWEDLKFAGLEVGDPNQSEEYKHMFGNAGIAFHQDVASKLTESIGPGGGISQTRYRSWVRGIRPDKQITSEEVMRYDVDHMRFTGPEDITIYAHFIWFDRR